jgi:hypothetical protein
MNVMRDAVDENLQKPSAEDSPEDLSSIVMMDGPCLLSREQIPSEED